jgi:xanthine/CO dehydrogenase XdhC/CoxF family maturation factor
MTDLERILPLWRELEAAAGDYVLATVVAVEGSSYRKPGACMLLAPDGRRAGTVSGGCLEGQVASRAWWLTAQGACMQRYSTAEEDGERPYGSGCGGVVHLLLERRSTAGPLLAALEQAFQRRIPLAVATVLEGAQLGCRAFSGLEPETSELHYPDADQAGAADLQQLAEAALASSHSMEKRIIVQGAEVLAWADSRPARPGLWIFGAGDDAQPLLRLAKELGWFVTVADGRAHLATRERFPLADAVQALPMNELPRGPLPAFAALHPQDAAAILTHSFDQDARILAGLLALAAPPAYVGVLGPQRRTGELLAEVARLLNLPAISTDAQAERWMAQLHAPMGLDLGAESPETIALCIVAEIQKTLAAGTGLPLRTLRAVAAAGR